MLISQVKILTDRRPYWCNFARLVEDFEYISLRLRNKDIDTEN